MVDFKPTSRTGKNLVFFLIGGYRAAKIRLWTNGQIYRPMYSFPVSGLGKYIIWLLVAI